MKVELLGGAYAGRSTNTSPETCINLFVDPSGQGSLVGTPGATEFVDLGSGTVRGMWEYKGVLYAVKGATLYSITSAGTTTSLGTVPGSGRVAFADNGPGNQLSITNGVSQFTYNVNTSTFSTGPAYATMTLDFQDGYMLFPKKDTPTFFVSNLYDSSTVDPLDFSSAEGSGSDLVSLLCDNREVWLFTGDSTEIFYNTGDANAPFQRFQGGFTQTGCAAAHTPAHFDNSVVWLSKNDRGQGLPVRAGKGYQPEVLTAQHPQVAYQISKYDRIDDAFSYVYQDEGHEFWVLTFPSANATWVYDGLTQQWHQRAHVIDSSFPNRERPNAYAFAFGKHLVGDMSSGKILKLSTEVYTYDGDLIPQERTLKGIRDDKDGIRIPISRVQIEFEEGVGGSAYLKWSKDDGHTYGTEIEKSIGTTGSYKHRALWHKLGRSRQWTFKFRRSEDAKTIITNFMVR